MNAHINAQKRRRLKIYFMDIGIVLAYRWRNKVYLLSLWPFGHFDRII